MDACLECDSCHSGLEQYCEREFTFAFNAVPKHGRVTTNTGYTLGGYSAIMTVPRRSMKYNSVQLVTWKPHSYDAWQHIEAVLQNKLMFLNFSKYLLIGGILLISALIMFRFLIRLPDSLALHLSAPILCAGVSMFSPLKHWSADKGGKRVGIAGLGGLGQMGIQIAKAMGNRVTAISTSRDKEAAAKALGASAFVLSSDAEAMSNAANSCDLIINTIAAGSIRLFIYLIPILVTFNFKTGLS